MRATALDVSTNSCRMRWDRDVSKARVVHATATVPPAVSSRAKTRLTSTLVRTLGTSMWKTTVMTSNQAQPTQMPNAWEGRAKECGAWQGVQGGNAAGNAGCGVQGGG